MGATAGDDNSGVVRSAPVTLATTTLSIAGLRGNACRGYRLVIWVKGAGADAALYLRPNGATTNLKAAVVYDIDGTVGGTTDTAWWVANLRTGSSAYITVDIWTKAGTNRRAVSIGTSETVSTDVISTIRSSCIWKQTTTEITSFDLVSTVAQSIDVGSTIEAYPLGVF